MDELGMSKMLASDMTPIEESKLIDELVSLRKVDQERIESDVTLLNPTVSVWMICLRVFRLPTLNSVRFVFSYLSF